MYKVAKVLFAWRYRLMYIYGIGRYIVYYNDIMELCALQLLGMTRRSHDLIYYNIGLSDEHSSSEIISEPTYIKK